MDTNVDTDPGLGLLTSANSDTTCGGVAAQASPNCSFGVAGKCGVGGVTFPGVVATSTMTLQMGWIPVRRE